MSREKQATPPQRLSSCVEKLKGATFTVEEIAQGRVRVSKHGCAAVLEETGEGFRFAQRPGLMIGQSIAHLVDHGFQKFWQDGAQRYPALAEQLQWLHAFQRDLRAVLGQATLYNQALGTVSSRYVYDRLEGREASKRHRPFD